MLAGELSAAFAKLAPGIAESRVEVADGLLAADQPLAALAVAAWWPIGIPDGYTAGIVCRVEEGIADGELDPVVAGSVAWAAHPTVVLFKSLHDTSPLWRGIPRSWDDEGRQLLPDPQAAAAWAARNANISEDASPLDIIAACGSPSDTNIQRALSVDDYQVAVAIVFIIASRLCWQVSEGLIDDFAAALGRAWQLQYPVGVLPPIII